MGSFILKINNVFFNLGIIFLFLLFNSFKIIIFHYKISTLTLSYCFYTFAIVSLVYLIIFTLKSRILAVLFFLLQFLYLATNYIYFSFFGIYLSPKLVYSLFEEGTITVTRGIFPFGPFLLLFLIDLPFFILILKKNYFDFFSSIKLRNKIIIFISLFIIIFFYIEFKECGSKELRRHQELHEEFGIVEKYGLLVWQMNLFSYENYYLEKLQKSERVIQGEGKDKLYNIIFIQVEAMDSFIINLEWQGKKIMPYLNEISKKSIYYPYTLSYHSGGGTSDAEFSIINSVEPLLYYPSIKIFNYSYDNSFVKILKKNGYIAKAFHGNYSSFFNRRYAFKAMGFDYFYDIRDMKLEMKGWGAADGDVFEFVLKELRNEKKPFFYYIITMSSHFPFTSVLNYYKNQDLYYEEKAIRNYFISLNYVDFILKKYLEKFLETPETYIFIFGDHPAFYFDSKFYKNPILYLNFRKYEFVPLLIITPERISYFEEKLCASFLDIAPTALYSSGVSFKYSTDGKNLTHFPIEDNYFSHYDRKYKRSEMYEKIEKEYKYLLRVLK